MSERWVREVFYWFARGLFAVYFRFFVNLKIDNPDRFPETGPVIVCANHISWFDPPLVSVVSRTKLHFMAKEELFGNAVSNAVMRGVNAFPVKRGTMDRKALRTSVKILREGGILCLFPEGTRQPPGEIGELTDGAAYLALRSGAPLLPVGICGRYTPFSGLRVRVGDLIHPDGQGMSEEDAADTGNDRRGRLRQLTEKLRQDMGVLAYGKTDRNTA